MFSRSAHGPWVLVFNLVSDRKIISLLRDAMALIFFNCLGQLVLIFNEFTF